MNLEQRIEQLEKEVAELKENSKARPLFTDAERVKSAINCVAAVMPIIREYENANHPAGL